MAGEAGSIRPLSPEPKIIPLEKSSQNQITMWLTGRREALDRARISTQCEIQKLQDKDDKPRSFLERFARRVFAFDAEAKQTLVEHTKDINLRLSDIKTAILDVQGGRVDRVQRLLEFEIQQAISYLTMRSHAPGPSLPGAEHVPFKAYGEAEKALSILEIIDPQRANELKTSLQRWNPE